MLLALTPIGFLRLNPTDLHQRKLLCEFTVRFRGGISSLLTHSPEPRKTVVPLLRQGQKQFSCYKY